MIKRKIKTLVGIFMSAIVVVSSCNCGEMKILAETTQSSVQTIGVVCRILEEGQERPASLEEISKCNWKFGGSGVVISGEQEYGQEVNNRVVSYGSETKTMLKKGGELQWFAIQRFGGTWAVYGQIVKDTEGIVETIEPTIEPVVNVNNQSQTQQVSGAVCRILARDEKRPSSLSEINSATWTFGGSGKFIAGEQVYGVSETMDRVVSYGDETEKLLKSGEMVEWFAIQKFGATWAIYGEILSGKVEVMPTVQPTAVPSNQVIGVVCRVLERGANRPSDSNSISTCNWTFGGSGKIISGIATFDEEVVKQRVVSVGDETTKMLKSGEMVEWFAIQKFGATWALYGEIICEAVCEENLTTFAPIMVNSGRSMIEATNAPTSTPEVKQTTTPIIETEPTVTPNPIGCLARILPLSETRPTSKSELGKINWTFGGTCYVLPGNEVFGEETENRVVDMGTTVKSMLQEGEGVHWFAFAKFGATNAVYGEIYNIKVEESIKNGVQKCNDAVINVDTVKDIKKLNKIYNYGTIIKTKGFSSVGDGGAADYKVEFRTNGYKYSTVDTSVGQHVNLVINDNRINLKQLGAGVCTQISISDYSISGNNDAARINEAINIIDKYDGGIIYIPAGEYRCDKKIYMGGDNYTIEGDGNKTVLYTDNGYTFAGQDEHFITVIGNNLTFTGIRVEARETKWVNYYRQLSVISASNINITNCEFSVKENVVSYDGNTDRQYTNITLYTGWHNIVVDNCLLEQMGCVERGASIGLIDMWSQGCSGARITNCVMRQNAHDEMLGIFTKLGSNASISDIVIENNEMYTASAANVSNKTMAITIGYDDSKEITNVYFRNNYVKAEVPSNFMTFGVLEDCYIEDNTFDIIHTNSSTSGVVFDARKGVTVQNNVVNISSSTGAGIQQVFKRYGTFINNVVNCNCYVYYIMYNGGDAINNTINICAKCEAVACDMDSFIGNTVNLKTEATNMIKLFGVREDTEIKDNLFKLTYNDMNGKPAILWNGYFIYAGFHAQIADHIINVEGNTIECGENISSVNKGLLCYGVGDSKKQTFIFKNNNVGVYRWIRSIYGQSIDGITTDSNIDGFGNAIDKSTHAVKGITDVK
ncbi:MAG: hypothetical protein K5895_04570 [Lachnospiraceae bacterium]|nr:hypothetical protein [Lachnospiraceae bacterium]